MEIVSVDKRLINCFVKQCDKRSKTILVDNDEIISEDSETAEQFSTYFESTVLRKIIKVP